MLQLQLLPVFTDSTRTHNSHHSSFRALCFVFPAKGRQEKREELPFRSNDSQIPNHVHHINFSLIVILSKHATVRCETTYVPP